MAVYTVANLSKSVVTALYIYRESTLQVGRLDLETEGGLEQKGTLEGSKVRGKQEVPQPSQRQGLCLSGQEGKTGVVQTPFILIRKQRFHRKGCQEERQVPTPAGLRGLFRVARTRAGQSSSSRLVQGCFLLTVFHNSLVTCLGTQTSSP